MIVKTETGSSYEFSDGMTHARRVNDNRAMRLDDEWVELHNDPEVKLGQPMMLVLDAPSTDSSVTYRHTSRVKAVSGG